MKMFALTSVVATLALGAALAGEPLKAGPQKGEELPGPFHPLNVNGESAGEKTCLYCRYGGDPVAMVFARSATPEVAKLVKQLDETIAKNKDADMHACIVFCSDETGLKDKLEALAKKADLKHVVLAIDNPAGPKGYNITKDSEVTVVMYVDRTVKANHAFRKDEFNDKAVTKVIGEVPTILPKK